MKTYLKEVDRIRHKETTIRPSFYNASFEKLYAETWLNLKTNIFYEVGKEIY